MTAYADSMTEKQLMQTVIDAARLLNYNVYHTHNSRRSEAGFPDIVALRQRDGRRYAIECKTAKGTPTPAQIDWLAAFSACGIPSLIVRPDDLDTVLETLR